MAREEDPQEDGLLLPVAEAARRLALSRTTVYQLMSKGELRGVRVGRARRVVASSLQEYLDDLEARR